MKKLTPLIILCSVKFKWDEWNGFLEELSMLFSTHTYRRCQDSWGRFCVRCNKFEW